MAKKILIFSLNYYPRFIGGAEVAIKEITDRIPVSEIEFHLITPRFDSQLPKHEHIGNVFVHRIGFATKNPHVADLQKFPLHLNKYYFQLLAPLAAHRLHKTYQFDGIWAMMAHSAGIPAGLFKRFHPGVRYLLTLQEGDPPQYIEKLMKPVWSLFVEGFTRADAVQAISTFLASWATRMGFSKTPVVIPNAVDISLFGQSFTKEQIQAQKEKLEKKEGDIFLVTTSRLVHKNAVDVVIRAMAKMPAVTFLVYGTGPDERFLRVLANEIGVANRVRFMGHIDHVDMPGVLSACDIFIRPSRSEGMGNSFIEAMAASLPVIATQEGGIADFLFDAFRNPGNPTTGWAVDANDAEQIVRAVEEITRHPDKTARVVATAQAMVSRIYDWNIIAKDMKSLFDELLKSR